MKSNTQIIPNMIGLFVSFIQLNEENQEEIIKGKVTDQKGSSVTVNCREYDYELTDVIVDFSDLTILDQEPNKIIRRFNGNPLSIFTHDIDGNPRTKSTENVENNCKPSVEKQNKVTNKSDKGPSEKLQKCIDIVNNNQQLKRKDLIDLIIKNVGMTPAGASTYLYNSQQYIKNNK